MIKQRFSNSLKTVEFSWEQSDQASGNLPTQCKDGSNIPRHTYGTNMDTGVLYFWTGSEWKEFGGES